MNPNSRKDKNKNNRRTAKAIDAMPIAGIVVAALLVLPGLTIVGGSYNSASAQQYTPGGGGGNATTGGGSQSEVMMHLDEVRKALQNNDNQGAMMHLDLAMNLLRGGSSSTQGNTTSKAPLS
jgi:hypothetical protein